MADLTTQLSKFLNDLMAGKLGVANAITSIVVGDGTAAAPGYAFASVPTTGIYTNGGNQISFTEAGVNVLTVAGAGEIRTSSAGSFSFSSAVSPASASSDTSLYRLSAGAVGLNHNLLGATSTDGFGLLNTTAATVGAQIQISPRLRFRGNAWNMVGLASETNDFFLENLPAVGNPSTATLKFGFSNNGGAATYPLTVTSNGTVTSLAGITISGASNFFTAQTGGGYQIQGSTYWDSAVDGKPVWHNSGNTAGIGLDVTVDSIANFRNRAQNADGGVRAAFYNSSASSVLTVTTNTIAPTGSIHHVGAGLIKTITVPALCPTTCSITIIPDAAYTYDATGNIVVPAGGGTAVVNKAMTFTWDGTKWTPSY